MTSASKNYNHLHNNDLIQDYYTRKANNASDQTTNVDNLAVNAANQTIDEIVATEQNKLGNSAYLNHNIKSEITEISQSMCSATMPRSGIYRKL